MNVLIYNHILLQTSNFSFKFQQWYSEHASQSDGSFVTFCQQSMIRKPPCTWGYVNPHLIHGSFSQLESWTQTTSWSVQHFLQAYYCDRPTDHVSWSVTLFHRRTRTAYVYNGCLVWYNVVLIPRIHSSAKYNQLGQSETSVTLATNQHAHYTCTRNRNDNKLTYTPTDCIARLSDTWN